MKREFKIIMEVVVGLTHGLRRSRAVGVVAIAAVAVVLAACGGGDDDVDEPLADSPPPTSPGTTEPAEPSEPPAETTEPAEPEETLSPEEQVLEDYLNAMQTLAAVYDPPDPDDPDLLARFDGDALERTRDALRELADEGTYEVITYESDAEVIALAPDSALVRDCYRVQARSLDAATGEAVDDPVDDVRNVDATLLPRDGTWVIAHRRQLEEPCTPGS